MPHIFISYARKDINLAEKIVDALAKINFDTWIDWNSIPKGEDWEQEIYRGIEEADAFLFLISEDSVTSQMCNKEIARAVKNGKRILPVFISNVVNEEVGSIIEKFLYKEQRDKISKRNFIFCREELNEFNKAIEQIQKTIHTDYEWVQIHRRLQVKALEWERNQKEHSFLLRGKDLQDAELQLATNSSKEPFPTDLQREYVYESGKTEEIQRRLSWRRRSIIALIGAVLLIMIVLAMTGRLNSLIYRSVDMQDYWVTIPAGKFLMGSSDTDIEYVKKLCSVCSFENEQPQHWVDLPEFQIGKYEVTNRQYAQCIKAGYCVGSAFEEGKDLYPVVNVSWHDAKSYCEWVGGRLPTEAEWEKAASWNVETQTKFIYPWGNDVPSSDLLNYSGNVGNTTPVGSYPLGENDLFDMGGNVMEWVNDWYDETYYQNSPSSNPSGPDTGQYRVLRGGSWSYIDSRYAVRSAFRYGNSPSVAESYIGFRCARSK